MSTLGRFGLAGTVLVAGFLAAVATAAGAGATTLTPGISAPAQLVMIGAGTGNAILTPLSVDQLVPGDTVVQRFQVHLTSGHSGIPAVGFQTIRDLERGCAHPEIAAGDTTCGSGDDQGELSAELLAGVTWQPATADGCDATAATNPTASLRSLQDQVLAGDQAVTSQGPDTCVTLTLSLPASADNLVQSDATSFDLRVGVSDAPAGTDGFTGGGGSLHAPGAGPEALGGGTLPMTGLPLQALALLAAVLVQLGLLALRLGRPRRD
jgi:hypothetical protein